MRCLLSGLVIYDECVSNRPNREYGTIDDVDIDLQINISFLDVSGYFWMIRDASVYAVFVGRCLFDA